MSCKIAIIVKLFKFINITSFVRKMSSDSFKGVPLEQIYRGSEHYHLNHLPPIQNKRDHTVLFQLPIANGSTSPPKPHFGDIKWDSHHVKLPCATQNEYKTESLSDPTKEVKTTRWDIIQTALLRPFANSRELEQAILTYNHKYAKEWKFKSLHALFEQLEDEDAKSFFSKTLPAIIDLALRLPELVPSSIPLLKNYQNRSISLSQQQIACLLANAFLCTFPRRNDSGRHSEFSSYPSINFSGLFQTPGDQNIEKIKCICNYFRRVCSKMPTGVVTFTRRSIEQDELPEWHKCQTTFADTLLHVSDDGTIEDDGEGLLQVDFANKFLGGGVLNYGCVQEEIRFVICPELLCSRLFTEVLKDNECLVMMGCERFSHYDGYASTFQWTGDYSDSTPLDSSNRKKCTIVAIDAVNFKNKAAQYTEEMIERELNKAYIGFKHELDSPAPGVATGNWGCGAFNGDKYLKSLLQLMACCVTQRPLVYYTFGDKMLRDELFMMYEYLVDNKVKIADLWTCLLAYKKPRRVHLYDFIKGYHKDLKNRKPSTNGQSSKQANRFNSKTKPKTSTSSKLKPKPTSITEFSPTKSDDELNALMETNDYQNEYMIEDSDDDDDQFSEDEIMEMINKSEPEHTKARPFLTRHGRNVPANTSMNDSQRAETRAVEKSPSENRPGSTITNFFPRTPVDTSKKNENQEKRSRPSMLSYLDDDYSRKSPAKVQRNSLTAKKTVTSPVNTSTDLKPLSPETESTATHGDEKKVDEKDANDESLFEDADESKVDETESRDSDPANNTAMSEDLFDDSETSGDYAVDFKKIDGTETEKQTPLKGIDKQRAMFKEYFTPNKRSNTSPFGNAQKKSADKLNESSGSSQDKSPSDRSTLDNEEGSSIVYETPEQSHEEQMELDRHPLLTDDESDNEVKTETDHLKSLNVTPEKDD